MHSCSRLANGCRSTEPTRVLRPRVRPDTREPRGAHESSKGCAGLLQGSGECPQAELAPLEVGEATRNQVMPSPQFQVGHYDRSVTRSQLDRTTFTIGDNVSIELARKCHQRFDVADSGRLTGLFVCQVSLPVRVPARLFGPSIVIAVSWL